MSQLLHMPFRGLDEGADPKTQPPGTLLVAINCRMDKARRLHKRWGTAPVGTDIVGGGSLSAGVRLVPLPGGGLGMTDGTNFYVYVEELDAWKTVDRVCPLTATRRAHLDTATSIASVDCAVSSPYLVTVWALPDSTYGGGSADKPIYFQVVDTETQDILCPPTLVTTTGRKPRVVIFNGKAVFVWANSTGELRYRDLTFATMALGTAGSLDTGLSATASIDVHVAGSTLYAVYRLAAGANRTRIRGFNTTYAASISPADFGGTTQSGYALHVTSGESAYLLASQAPVAPIEVVIYTFLASNLSTTAGPTVLFTETGSNIGSPAFVARDSASDALVGIHETDSVSGFSVMRATTMVVNGDSHAVTANTTRRTNHVQWVSEPFQISSRWYAVAQTYVGGSSSIEPSSDVLLEIRTNAYSAAVAPHPHVGTLENQTAGTSGSGVLYSVPVVDTVAWVMSRFRREERESEYAPIGVNMNRVTTGGDTFRPLQNGRVLALIGAAPTIPDGYTVQPYGFLHGPRIGTITWSGAGGSVTAGDYQYAGHYVRQGPDGILQRSPLGNVRSTTAGATDTGTVPFACAAVSPKLSETTGFSGSASDVRVFAFRTENDGSALYLLTFEPVLNTVTSSPTTAAASLTDTRADSDVTGGAVSGAVALTTRPGPYTESELDDVCPPASTTGTAHRNRFFLIASDEHTVWASKDGSEDQSIAPGFNEALTLAFPTRKKALAGLDEKLVAFGEDDIDIVHGDGPDSNGDNSTWQIQRLQTEVGCTNPRSVAVTPMGVTFECRGQLYLLGRDLTIARIGTAVEDTLASYPTITSAVLVADEGEVRFTCIDNADRGVVIAWDYVNSFWCVRRYYDEGTDNGEAPFADAALVDGVYTALMSNGQIYREDKDTFLDAGEFYVERDVQLSWVSPAGPNAWHRFRRWQVLGTNTSNHDLKLSVARDYATAWFYDNTFAAQTTPTTVGPIAQARVHPTVQKSTAQRLRLQDLTPTTGDIDDGGGPIWEAVTLEFDVKRSTARTSAAEQA